MKPFHCTYFDFDLGKYPAKYALFTRRRKKEEI